MVSRRRPPTKLYYFQMHFFVRATRESTRVRLKQLFHYYLIQAKLFYYSMRFYFVCLLLLFLFWFSLCNVQKFWFVFRDANTANLNRLRKVKVERRNDINWITAQKESIQFTKKCVWKLTISAWQVGRFFFCLFVFGVIMA